VIYITHRPDDVAGADHCIWLEEGCVRHQGEPSLFRTLPRRMQSLSV
jgi:ABC-type transport system involved in cytochrome bd biosynthesis fused ATPase/permease subunit